MKIKKDFGVKIAAVVTVAYALIYGLFIVSHLTYPDWTRGLVFSVAVASLLLFAAEGMALGKRWAVKCFYAVCVIFLLTGMKAVIMTGEPWFRLLDRALFASSWIPKVVIAGWLNQIFPRSCQSCCSPYVRSATSAVIFFNLAYFFMVFRLLGKKARK